MKNVPLFEKRPVVTKTEKMNEPHGKTDIFEFSVRLTKKQTTAFPSNLS